MSAAWAHPGHYVPGEALADATTPALVDLRQEAPVVFAGNGVSGHFGSAEAQLGPRDGVTAYARGRAELEGRVVVFEVRTDLDAAVAGIAVGADVSDRGHFGVGVDLARWLGRIDFGALEASTSTISFAPGSQGHNAFVRGVRSTAAFVVEED